MESFVLDKLRSVVDDVFVFSFSVFLLFLLFFYLSLFFMSSSLFFLSNGHVILVARSTSSQKMMKSVVYLRPYPLKIGVQAPLS